MTIKVISQTTSEQKEETIRLFHECKPFLDEGYSLAKTVKIILGVNHQSFTRYSWYKELRKYVESQGYKGRV